MAWTAPSTFVAGAILTAAQLNTNVRDNSIAGHPLYSTLPGSPTDGDTIYYQTTAMASLGVAWNLRYRSAGGTYKWEYVGGSPIYASALGAVTATTSTPTAKTNGPSFTVPLAGVYMLNYGVTLLGTIASSYVGAQPYYNATQINADSEIANALITYVSAAMSFAATLATAGNTLELYYKADSGTGTFIRRWLRAVPVMVG